MSVGYLGSSGTGDLVSVTSRAAAIPAGAAADDIMIAYLVRWGSTTPGAVTAPGGFTRKDFFKSGDNQAECSVWWKRLTGADSGTYSFSWTGALWSGLDVVGVTGGVTTGDPLGPLSTWVGTAGNYGSLSVTTVDEPFLLWLGYNDTSSAHTPPTNYTELLDHDCYTTAYRIPATTGTQIASGASVTSSSLSAAGLIDVLPAPTGPTYNPPTGMPPNDPVDVASVAQPLIALGIAQDNS